MPDQFWNVIGALTIFAAVAASHPLRPAQADRIQERLATGWHEMVEIHCDDSGPNQCLPAFWTP